MTTSTLSSHTDSSSTPVAGLALAPGVWEADPAHTTVSFMVRHLGLAKVRGRFADVAARLVVGDDMASTSVSAEVALASVATGNADRDTHLASSDFFNAESNPMMTFVSTLVSDNGDGTFSLAGDLTINAVTKPVVFDVEFFGTSQFPLDGSTRAGFSATGSISRKEFGVTFDVPLGGDRMMIGDAVAIELDVQVVAPA